MHGQNTVLLSRKQAADYLGVEETTLAVWAKTKRQHIPHCRIGKLIKYKKADLDAFIDLNMVQGVEAIDE